MANSIGLITKYGTKAWDKVYKAEACSSVLDGDKDLLKFTGVKTVKIAKFSSTGLGDYNRANKHVEGNYAGNETGYKDGNDFKGYGYQQGNVSLEWEEFTIRCDRGTQLRIELFDDEETDGLAVAAATKEFSRTKVVPEVDAYVFSELARLAGTVSTSEISLGDAGSHGYNPNGPLQALNNALEVLGDLEVPDADQVIFCSNKFFNQLRSTGEIIKTLKQTEYGENVKFSVGEYEGREIIAVPANRFRTLIQLNGDDGYTWKDGSQKIDFMVVAKSAVAHVTKYDKVKVFSPEVVQDFDGYKVNIRIYHDVFVPDNKRIGIYVHTSNVAPAAETVALPSIKAISNIELGDNEAIIRAAAALVPGDIIIDGLYYAASAPTVGAAIGSVSGAVKIAPYEPFTVARAAASGADKTLYIFAVKDGKVYAVDSVNTIVVKKKAA